MALAAGRRERDAPGVGVGRIREMSDAHRTGGAQRRTQLSAVGFSFPWCGDRIRCVVVCLGIVRPGSL